MASRSLRTLPACVRCPIRSIRFSSSISSKPADSSIETTPQAPNYPTTWSEKQRPRPGLSSGPRFEQVSMPFQPNPPSAMAMISEEPVRIIEGRKAICNGGGGPLGHPKIYINLDKPEPRPCGYCGLRFQQAPHHH